MHTRREDMREGASFKKVHTTRFDLCSALFFLEFWSQPSLFFSFVYSTHTYPHEQMPIDFTHWPSKVANIIVYVALLSGNLYATFGADKGTESPYHSKHQSYITPAPFTFYMWTVIHFLLGGMVVYQWFTDKVHQATSWHFCVASVMNTAWLALWVRKARGSLIQAFNGGWAKQTETRTTGTIWAVSWFLHTRDRTGRNRQRKTVWNTLDYATGNSLKICSFRNMPFDFFSKHQLPSNSLTNPFFQILVHRSHFLRVDPPIFGHGCRLLHLLPPQGRPHCGHPPGRHLPAPALLALPRLDLCPHGHQRLCRAFARAGQRALNLPGDSGRGRLVLCGLDRDWVHRIQTRGRGRSTGTGMVPVWRV